MPVLAPVECASDTEAATGVDCNTGNTDCVTSAGDGSGSGSAEVDGEAGCSRSDTDGFRLRGGGGGGGGGTVSCSFCC